MRKTFRAIPRTRESTKCNLLMLSRLFIEFTKNAVHYYEITLQIGRSRATLWTARRKPSKLTNSKVKVGGWLNLILCTEKKALQTRRYARTHSPTWPARKHRPCSTAIWTRCWQNLPIIWIPVASIESSGGLNCSGFLKYDDLNHIYR